MRRVSSAVLMLSLAVSACTEPDPSPGAVRSAADAPVLSGVAEPVNAVEVVDQPAVVEDAAAAALVAAIPADATAAWTRLAEVATPDRGLSWADQDNPIVSLGSLICSVSIGTGLIYQDFFAGTAPVVHATFMGEGLISDGAADSRRLYRLNADTSVTVDGFVGASADGDVAVFTESGEDGCFVQVLDGELTRLDRFSLDAVTCRSDAAIFWIAGSAAARSPRDSISRERHRRGTRSMTSRGSTSEVASPGPPT